MQRDQWELRNKALDFVQVAVLTKDEAALVWLLQKVVMGLRELVVAPEIIVKRVRDCLPGKEG